MPASALGDVQDVPISLLRPGKLNDVKISEGFEKNDDDDMVDAKLGNA